MVVLGVVSEVELGITAVVVWPFCPFWPLALGADPAGDAQAP